MLWWTMPAAAATLRVGPDAPFSDLDEALAAASPGDRIEVSPGKYRGSVWIDKSITIVSTGGASVTTLLPDQGGYPPPVVGMTGSTVDVEGFTIDGDGRSQYAVYGENGTYTLDGLVVHGAYDRDAMVHTSTLTVTNSLFEGAVGTDSGHLFVDWSTVELDDDVFVKGGSWGGGGAFLRGCQAAIRRCTFQDNRPSVSGGAIYDEDDTALTIEDSLFDGNQATWGRGGAIVHYGGQLEIARTRFVGNASADGGGAIEAYYAYAFHLVDSDVEGTTSTDLGSTIRIGDTTETVITGTRFVGNTTGGDGGAFALVGWSDSGEFAGNTFCDNRAAGAGGAVLLDSWYGVLSASVHNNVFLGNSAGVGGGAISVGAATTELDQNTIVGSTTDSGTGAVWVRSWGAATLINNAIVGSVGAAGSLEEPYGYLFDDEYTLLWDNDQDFLALTSSPNTVVSDPGFRAYTPGDCDSDLRPATDSPLVDEGDPTLDDDDGTRSDIGAYGGPGASALVDVDGDGAIAGDCSAFDPTMGGAGPDVPGDGIDPDCDGREACYVDGDGDGAGSDELGTGPVGCEAPGWAPVAGDCDDSDPKRAADCEGPRAGAKPPPAWFCSTDQAPELGWPLILAAAVTARAAGRRRPR